MKKAVLTTAAWGIYAVVNFATPSTVRADDQAPSHPPSIDQAKVFQSYCQWMKDSNDISRQVDEKFGVDIDNKTWLKKDGWTDKKNEKLAKKVELETGVDHYKMIEMASEDDWNQKCTSIEAGLVNVGIDDALAATEDDSMKVQEALTNYYQNRLKSGVPDPFFDPSRFSSINCKEKQIENYRIIGCYAFAFFGSRTSYDIYIVGHVDGKPVITPLSPDPNSTRIAGAKTLADFDMNEIAVGHFTKYPVPEAFLRAKRKFSEAQQ